MSGTFWHVFKPFNATVKKLEHSKFFAQSIRFFCQFPFNIEASKRCRTYVHVYETWVSEPYQRFSVWVLLLVVMTEYVTQLATLQRRSDLCIPRNETTLPRSQFPLSCFVSYLCIPRIGLLILQQNRETNLWEHIYRSQKHECGNWEWGPAV